MVNNTVNEVVKGKKKFKAAGLKETPRIVAVEIRQQDRENIKALKDGSHVSVPTLRIEPINLQAGEFVSIKAYPGGNPNKEKKEKEEITH